MPPEVLLAAFVFSRNECDDEAKSNTACGDDTNRLIEPACVQISTFLHARRHSMIVRRAFLRSGIKTPSFGSHILRHSLASEMLRQGVPLYGIATLLRHRSIDTTTLYAKVDLDLLRQVAQPWPEVLR
jgi:integrase